MKTRPSQESQTFRHQPRVRVDLLLGLIGAVSGFALGRVLEFPVYAAALLGMLLGFVAGELWARRLRARQDETLDPE